MRTQRLAALAAAAVVLLASGCQFDGASSLPLPGGIVSDEDSYAVTADFTDVLAVVPRTAVMVDDVPVGEVKQVERVGWHARLTLWVRNDVELPDNAVAEIRQTSLLGEKYVALLPPHDQKPQGQLSDGDEIALPDTGRNPEVEEVLGALSFLLSGGGVGQLATITHELNAVMNGRQDRLRSLLGRLDGVVGTLDQQKGEIIAAMTSINDLTATLNRERKTIGDAVDSLGPAVDVLSAQHMNLVAMLRSLDRLGAVGTRVISASRDDLLNTLRELQPVLSKLHEAGSSIGPGLSLLLSFPFPKESNDIVHGDYANTIMQVDVTLKSLQGGGGPGQAGPSLPIPSLPIPSLPIPSVPIPSVPIPSVPIPSVPIPSLPIPSLPSIPGLPRAATGTAVNGSVSRQVAGCAQGRSLLAPTCRDSIATTAGFHDLLVGCRVAALRTTAVCRSLAALPIRQVADNGLSSALDPLGSALTSAFDTPMGTATGIYGGAS